MDITHLIAHPEELNQETLYDLRRLVAVYPTYHAARILFLQNLFILHDPAFDQELRRAALLVPDRRVLFAMTQSPTAHAKVHKRPKAAEAMGDAPKAEAPAQPEAAAPAEATPEPTPLPTGTRSVPKKKYAAPDTTAKLLDNFLNSTPQPLPKKQIKADPSTDYMAYLMQQEDVLQTPPEAKGTTEEAGSTEAMGTGGATGAGGATGTGGAAGAAKEKAASELTSDERLFSLIDSFIASQEEGISLSEDPMIPEGITDDEDAEEVAYKADDTEENQPTKASDAQTPAEAKANEEQADVETEDEESGADEKPLPFAESPEPTEVPEIEEVGASKSNTSRGVELSETLAQIYIKQQKYDRAIEVLNKINTPEANAANPYLADQMRFLQKLAHINAKKSTKSK